MRAAERVFLQGDVETAERFDARAPRSTRDPRASFLRIPPFPGAKLRKFETIARCRLAADTVERLSARIRELQVGGTYWAAQPEIPRAAIVLRAPVPAEAVERLARGRPIVFWERTRQGDVDLRNAVRIHGDCDPWHVLSGATAVVTDADDELCAIAAFMDVPAYTPGEAGTLVRLHLDPSLMVRDLAGGAPLANPFTGEEMSVREAIELCGFWRSLIDSNRDLAGGLGFAFWKQGNVAPLLWGGSGPFEFLGSADGLAADRPVAVWRSKAPAAELARLAESGVPIVEVEDGFLRSQGLGADCVPPLSITVDRLGAYFDPAQPSELELLVQDGTFDEQLLERARKLRSLIVASGLGKYERGGVKLERPPGERRHILVPGQVEDDRSVMTGGGGLSNLELLRRVRQDAPHAYILYKPHPDVVAGHRKGAIPNRTCRELADEIVSDLPISSLIEMVDEVHVNTSLAGFEALMREKAVTAYGVPFYAGWGLTRDKGPVPARRTARRTLDELVAAALLLYPRYLDPVSGLPCPAEVVVDRLTSGAAQAEGVVVLLRRLQGKLMRRLRSVVS